MEYSFQYLKLRHLETRRLLFLSGVMAVTYLSFQSLLLPYGNALRSLLPQTELQTQIKGSVLSAHSFVKSVMVRNPLTVNSSVLIEHDTEPKGKEVYQEIELVLEGKGIDDTFENAIDRNVDDNSPSENFVAVNEIPALVSFENQENVSIQDKADEFSTENFLQEKSALTVDISDGVNVASSSNGTSLNNLVLNGSISVGLTSKNGSSMMTSPGKKKKMKCEMPPKSITSISEMNRILVRKHASGRSLRPRWSSVRDREILAVKSQIEHPPVATNDPELYAPLFRNASMFKRSYELMERTLKVYIYKDGNKPIFHQPILKGLYASEGWFMKLMEGHRRFSVKDPRKAHLFYMPFSSRMLEYTLYVRNSHNRTNLRQFLKEYSETIAAKYPYWNRTGGADHFLVACHDWAPYETRHHMERCIKALCNADVTTGFKIGRDVSLAETYVRSARNPLRDLGGKPPSQRDILAFYAGNMHGYLRPILLKSWKDQDPDMKIFGPMPPGVASKMDYIHHMKSSKYCICPKGYEVNSPRVVEAIFYECIPVIISDNFVPPFFEVLNWEAFSVILAEKDIPNLKEVLLSIQEEKYLQMQLAVRKVQKHFLWHAKPLKYDLFHMTLHSIWYNRVFQIRLR